MEKKSNRIILIVAICSFVLACLEGLFYYSKYDCVLFIRCMLILQNSIKAFLFTPVITIENVISSIDNSTTFLELSVHYIYIISIFTAPVCTATAVFRAIELFLRKKMFHIKKIHRDEIIIFGYHRDVKILFQNINAYSPAGKDKRVIHLITKTDIGEAEELALSQKGVIVYRYYFPDEFKKDEFQTLCKKIELDKVKSIIFYEESAAANLSLYLMFTDQLKEFSHHRLKFYCFCDDGGIQAIAEDFYDTRAKKDYDLVFFDIDDLKTRRMFEEHPLYTFQKDIFEEKGRQAVSEPGFWNVHMLIIGFGKTGQQILKQAVNLAVLHSKSELLFDIIDYDIGEKKSCFLNMFCPENIEETENEIIVGRSCTDGILRIRFHQLDIQKYEFKITLEQIISGNPLTYAAVCLRSPEHSIRCMIELEKLLLRDEKERSVSVPVAVRLEVDRQIAEYLEHNTALFKDVFSMPAERDVLSFDFICSEKHDSSAIHYHWNYQSIKIAGQVDMQAGPEQGESETDREELWNALPLYKQQSNRMLSYHDLTKRVVFGIHCGLNAESAGELEEYRKNMDQVPLVFQAQDLLFQIRTNPVLNEMARMEHRRWSYFMLMNGWKYGESKDEFLKLSPYLCGWEKLFRDHEDMAVYDIIPVFVWMVEH